MGLQYNAENGPDIHIRRNADGVVTVNVAYVPSDQWNDVRRFSIGDQSEGTYDLALNILNAVRPGHEVEVKREDGRGCIRSHGRFSSTAVLLHGAFAHDFLVTPKGDNLDIPVGVIRDWIRHELRMRPESDREHPMAQIYGYVDATFVEEEGIAIKRVELVEKATGAPAAFGDGRLSLVLVSREEDAPAPHLLFKSLLGKRLKITITEVTDE